MQPLEIESQALALPDQAAALAVTTAAEYERAAEFLTGIKSLRREIDDTFDPIIAKQFAAHREAVAQKRKVEAPLVAAEVAVKMKVANYLEAEERERRRREAELAAIAKAEEDAAREAEALALEAAGEHEAAAQVIEAPAFTPSIVLPKPTAAGVSSRVAFRGECFDVKALCRAVADGKAPVNAVQPNTTAINQAARALREAFAWPGCRAVAERIVSAGRR